MRSPGGYTTIVECMEKLKDRHQEHIKVYGDDNHLRLTGLHETSSMDSFSWGVADRGSSVKIPNSTGIIVDTLRIDDLQVVWTHI